jgi:hypothetical protein
MTQLGAPPTATPLRRSDRTRSPLMACRWEPTDAALTEYEAPGLYRTEVESGS